MEKHLLVTISENQRYLYGVRFVSDFFSNKSEIKITLYYLVPRPARVWEGEKTLESLSQSEQSAGQYQAKGKKALEFAKKELIKHGFKDKNIKTKLQMRRFSKTMEIVEEAEMGLYDAVVLGRRGLSWMEELFDESLSKALLKTELGFPLWICRDIVPDYKNVLVCVDGSDACFRMVDHVGFILNQEPGHDIVLFTIEKTDNRAKMDEIFSTAKTHLERNGIAEDRIKTKISNSGNICKAILLEARQEKFGAVAVGRIGANRGVLGNIFTGSVSSKLTEELVGAALWVCQ